MSRRDKNEGGVGGREGWTAARSGVSRVWGKTGGRQMQCEDGIVVTIHEEAETTMISHASEEL